MGNASTRQLPVQLNPQSYIQSELTKFVIDRQIGDGKFMKTFIARIDGIPAIVKLYLKYQDEDVRPYSKMLTMQLKQLSPQLLPNIMPYQIWTMSSKPRGQVSPAFIIRQYFHSSLLDRIATRPFLTLLEKKWIVYQLLRALKQAHTGTITGGIAHGDIKPENIMVTSWNWVVLTDFAPYKPVLLPDDDTTNYNFYFSTGKRHACYLAPERFYSRANVSSNLFLQSAVKSLSASNALSSDSSSSSLLSPALLEESLLNGVWGGVEATAAHCKMDIFSLGCVIAELFRDGDPLFDLSTVLQYRVESSKAETQVQMRLEKLRSDTVLYDMINSMISRDPSNRRTSVEYANLLESSGWYPSYFKFLNEFFLMQHWTGSTPDDRILLACDNLESILEELGLVNDDAVSENEMTAAEAVDFFGQLFRGTDFTWNDDILRDMATRAAAEEETKKTLMAEINRTVSRKSLRISNKKILTSISHLGDQRKLSNWSEQFLKDKMNVTDLIDSTNKLSGKLERRMADNASSVVEPSSSLLDIPGDVSASLIGDVFGTRRRRRRRRGTDADGGVGLDVALHPQSDGITLILQIICGNMRHVRLPQSRISCLLLLLFFSRHCSQEIVLERLVPFVACCFNDLMGHVRACAVRVLACMLTNVDSFPAIEAQLFPKYVFQLLGSASRDSDFVVRIAFAETLTDYALASKKFLEYGHLLRQIKQSKMRKASWAAQAAAGGSAEKANLQRALPLVEGVYDKELRALRDQFGRWIRECCAESLENTKFSVTVSSVVKRVLLDQILKICLFFGPDDAVDRILPQFFTFLNGREWELRRTFCIKIVELCSFVGSTTTEQILPLIDNVLFDAEELVVEAAIKCLVTLTELRLISADIGIEKLKLICPLLLSPSSRVRYAILSFIQALSMRAGQISSLLYMIPMLDPLLRSDKAGLIFSCQFIPMALRPPLSRRAYNLALVDKCTKLKQAQGIAKKIMVERQSTQLSVPVQQPKVRSSAAGGVNGDDFGDLLEAIGSDASKVLPKGPKTSSRGSVKTPSPQQDLSLSSSPSRPKKHQSISQLTDPNPLLTAGITPDDMSKICLLDDCISSCAKECNQREIQWIESSQQKQTSTSSGKTANRSTVMDGSSVMLEASSALTVGHTKIIAVPSHKNFIDQAASEEARSMASKRLVYIMDDLNLIRKLYNFTAHSADMSKPEVGAWGLDGTVGGNDEVKEMNSTPADAVSANPSLATGRQQATLYPRAVARKIVALNIPPLPADYGALIQSDGRKFSSFLEPLNLDNSADPQNRSEWRPRSGLLVFSNMEHTQSVNRLVVSMDHTYFASASSDCTVKIWQLRGMDRVVTIKSSSTYNQHTDAVTDLAVIENSHSIASASNDGSLHVWRVDMAVSGTQVMSAIGGGISGLSQTRTTIQGSSVIKKVDKVEEGPITSVQNFSSDFGSFLIYTTQMGNIHTWDLRMDRDSSVITVGPELGNITTSSIGGDRNWICVGTSKGYVALYDIRFGIMFNLWRHSSCGPIYRVAISRNLPKKTMTEAPSTDGSYLFMSAGNNEASVFAVPDGGLCIRCFRSIPLQNEYLLGSGLTGYHAHLPTLDPVEMPSHPMGFVQSALFDTGPRIMVTDSQMPVHSVRSIMGRVSQNTVSYLMTAGTDRSIRFWDFTTPVKCYSVCGVEAGQPKPTFDSPYLGDKAPHGRLFVCHDASIPTSESADMSPHLPQKDYRGPRAPATHHQDSIMDLKTVDLPFRMMISCSRDGAIKGWR